jgi:hypothetical protein
MDPLIEPPAFSEKYAVRVRASPNPKTRAHEHLVHLVQKCVLRTSRVASPAQEKPLRGGLNQGPRRLGPVHDPLFPPRVYLRGLFDLDPLLLLPSRLHPPRSASVPEGFGEHREALGPQRCVWALTYLKSPASRTDNDKMNL